MIRKLGTDSRLEIEKFIGQKVFEHGCLKMGPGRQGCEQIRRNAREVYKSLQSAPVIGKKGQNLERYAGCPVSVH